MVRPPVEPASVYFKSEPGEVSTLDVVIAKAPTDTVITASVVNGNSLIVLKYVTTLELIRRPATRYEIDELPPQPPSIRERFREEGMEEEVEIERSDGSLPLAVSAGFKVKFHLEFSAPQQQAPDVTFAALLIDGTSWERVEVPMFFLMGKTIAIPDVEPKSIRLAAEPGETINPDFVIANVPAYAKIMAFIANGGPIIRLKRIITFNKVRREFSDSEIDEMPARERKKARDAGYYEYQEAGSTDGSTPLDVAKGQRLVFYLEASAPEQQAPDFTSATLVIMGTTWQRVKVPLFLIIGKVMTSLSTSSLSIRQGESGDLGMQATSIAGPSNDVDYLLGMNGGQWMISPPTINVARGSTVSWVAKVAVKSIAPEGTYPVGIQARSFEGLQYRNLPFDLTVLPGRVSVRALQTSLAATQGDSIICGVEVISQGGYKKMTFAPIILPRGVRMEAPVEDYYGSFKTVTNVNFVVESRAWPINNAPVMIAWSAGDGIHSGILELSFTVQLRLETKVFSQPIVTDAPLGGHVTMALQNDGNYRFSGYMEATGLFSYKSRLRVVVRSASGRVALLAQKTCEVFGKDTPGPSKFVWDDPVTPEFPLNSQWPDIKAGTMTVNRSTKLAGTFGSIVDFMSDVLEFVGSTVILSSIAGGPALAGLIFLGSELGSLAGVRVVGPGGLVGVMASGGMIFVLGPGVIIPAFVAGVFVGNLLVRHKPLNEYPEALAMAREVFGDSLPYDRIILTNLSGEKGQEFVTPNIDGSILVNLGIGYDNPETHKDPRRGYIVDGQILIHELVHAWQIANKTFVSEVLWAAILDKLEGEAAYDYGPPSLAWSQFGLEAQASIIDEWFAGTKNHALDQLQLPNRLRKDPNDPYFGYINNNIRLGEG